MIDALRPHLPNAVFTGLGGTEMESAGQQRIVHAEDVAVMGITEILRHIPRIYLAYRRLVRSIRQNKPDIAILIDFPDVNFRLAKHLRKAGVPVFWFVSPQLWAWKRGRLRWVQQRVSKMFVIFPFEKEFYRNRGVDAEFVGHPLADLPTPSLSREAYAEKAKEIHQDQWNHSDGILQSSPLLEWAFHRGTEKDIRYALDAGKPWIALLPGSRNSEIQNNLWEMIKAASLLGTGYEYIIPVAPTIHDDSLKHIQYEVGQLLTQPNPPRITFVRDARAALFHARASVVASGTATVQATLIGNPFIVVYKVSTLTFRLAKWLIRYPAEIPAPLDEHGNLPIAMPNLIAGKRIVPELINKNMTSYAIAKELKVLLEDSEARRIQVLELETLRNRLKLDTEGSSIAHLRDAVLSALHSNPSAEAEGSS